MSTSLNIDELKFMAVADIFQDSAAEVDFANALYDALKHGRILRRVLSPTPFYTYLKLDNKTMLWAEQANDYFTPNYAGNLHIALAELPTDFAKTLKLNVEQTEDGKFIANCIIGDLDYCARATSQTAAEAMARAVMACTCLVLAFPHLKTKKRAA